MVQYKLFYFNCKGRGEIIRLLFAAAGEKYEDVRIEGDEWSKYKSKSPTGQCPYLEIHDGPYITILSQSITIARFLARKFGIAGRNELEQAEMEMYGDQITDMQSEIVKAFCEKDEFKRIDLVRNLIAQKLARHFIIFETKLNESQSGYFSESGLTWVDLYLFHVLEKLGAKKTEAFENFETLKAHDKRIRELPKIAEWLAKRPKTN